VISNRHGFIFLHAPKTGGTSVSHSIIKDTLGECDVRYEADGEGISSIYPNQKDFPWWSVWIEEQAKFEEYNTALWSQHYQKTDKTTPSAVPLVNTDVTVAFSRDSTINNVGHGNIKHLPKWIWSALLSDRRLQHYGSFLDSYTYVATCRNPYTREFSWFLYENKTFLKELESTLKSAGKENSYIASKIREAWSLWAHNRLASDELSQANHSVLLSTNEPDIHNPTNFIRLENIEQDYNKLCQFLGMERRTKTIPHALNNKKRWAEYLPENIIEWYDDRILFLIHKNRSDDFKYLPYKKGEV
jgi:hypothetical protein